MEQLRRRSLSDRMIGASLLRPEVYEEVEADSGAMSQAALVVGLVAIANAVGNARAGLGMVIGTIIAAYFGWLLWSAITYLIGAKILGGTATWGELLRTIGFAQSPGVLYLLGFIPLLGGLIRFVVAVWILVAVIIAIRQALDFSTGRALLTALLGFVVYVILGAIMLGLSRV